MRRFSWIRVTLFLRQSRWGFVLIVLWFALGTFAFYHWAHVPLKEAFLNAIYFREHRGSLWDLYSFWGQCSNLGRLELRWRGGQSFGVGGGYSAGRSSYIHGPSPSNYTRCGRAFNPVKTGIVVPEEFEFQGQVKP